MNALLGYRRAIVSDDPGTTRDVVTATTAVEGWPVELADTAGLCETRDAVEQAGVARTHEELTRADAVLLVFSASEPESDDNRQLRENWPRAICVCNKSDLPARHQPPRDAIATSAVAGTGIDRLLAAISRRIAPNPPPPHAAVPFLPQHVETIEAALGEIERNNHPAALSSLEALLNGFS
jgi:tRNA modification GTPase